MSDFFRSVFESMNTRIKNPLVGSFVIAWMAWNWRFWVVLFSGLDVESKVPALEALLTDKDGFYRIGIPALIALGHVTLSPWFAAGAEWITCKADVHTIKFGKERRKGHAQAKIDARDDEILNLDNLITRLKSDLLAKEEELKRLEGVRENAAAEHERQKEIFTQETEAIKAQQEALQGENESVKRSIEKTKKREESLGQRVGALQDESFNAASVLETTQGEIRGAEKRLASLKNEYDSDKAGLFHKLCVERFNMSAKKLEYGLGEYTRIVKKCEALAGEKQRLLDEKEKAALERQPPSDVEFKRVVTTISELVEGQSKHEPKRGLYPVAKSLVVNGEFSSFKSLVDLVDMVREVPPHERF